MNEEQENQKILVKPVLFYQIKEKLQKISFNF